MTTKQTGQGARTGSDTPPVGEGEEERQTRAGEPGGEELRTPGGEEEPRTYDEEYVTRLREEAATHRVKAKRAADAEDRLRTLAIERAAAGILTDPADLEWTDDFADEDGWPNAEKIKAAAEALALEKPHLSRPRGNVGQGVRSEAPPVSLADLLRAGA